jgi:adenylate cyclase
MHEMSGLSETELAARAATTPERVRRLADLGILQPEQDGSFRQVDINRIRLAEALDASGLSLEHLGQAIASGQISLGFLDNLWPEPQRFLPAKTMGEIAGDYGLQWDLVESSHVRLGLSRPSRDAPVREDEVLVFRAGQIFLGAGLDEAAQVRFSRVMGENIRRLAEAQIHFFDRTVMGPMLDSGLTEQQAWDISSQMAPQLTPLFEELLTWLYRRQQEHYLLQDIVEHLENAMDTIGLGRGRMASPPAIAFLDLSGFTRLTDEQGDEAAAGLAGSLAELVQDAAHAHSGKPVKLLGDGVMFHFPRPADAVRCALEMVVEAPLSGLPPAHVGVDAGPVVFQDGDYFGRTVNVAARIVAKAGPGQVLVSDAVVAVAEGDGLAFTEIGPAELKGVASPVILHEAARSPST